MLEVIKAIKTTFTTPLSFSESLSYHNDKTSFLSCHRSYRNPRLSSLRRNEFSRLDKSGSVYLDYTGAALYPETLVTNHARWLSKNVAGNPHSTSPSALLSERAMEEARKAVLDFFDASEEEYHVIWTPNATGGFKIIGEAYNFNRRKTLIPRDAHNSLNSLARKAQARGGSFEFVEFDTSLSLTRQGEGEKDSISNKAYLTALSSTSAEQRGLAFFTGQSNITGVKLDLSLLSQAKILGWDTGLDAAALAPSTRISLRSTPVDFMVVSLYKICGYPTGLGALIMKKEMYAKLTGKETFFGGNIKGITMDRFDFELVDGVGRFEDGTANFLAMSAVKDGLEWAGRWIESARVRNKALLEWVVKELDEIYYPASEEVVGEKCSSPTSSTFSSSHTSSIKSPHLHTTTNRGVKLLRIPPTTRDTNRGSTLPLVFSSSSGLALNYKFIIWAAGEEKISLRGGPCMCNPGASSSVMQRGLITDLQASNMLAVADVGIVRVSLGVVTNFRDCWRLVAFCKKLIDRKWTGKMWKRYEMEMGEKAGTLENDIDALQRLATRKK